MTSFLRGLGTGVVVAGAAAAGLAWAQAPTFPPPSMNRVGLPNNYLFTVVCTTSNNTYDASRKLVVLRPQGNQNSPDVTLRCEPR